MTLISVIFDGRTEPGTTCPPLSEAEFERRNLVRSALSSLIWEGASELEVLTGECQLTVRRIHDHPTPVLVDAAFPGADGVVVTYRLCNTSRRLSGPFGPVGGPLMHNHHLIRLGEPLLNLAISALDASGIDNLKLSGELRWRHGDDDSLFPLMPG